MKYQIPKGLFDILPYGTKETWTLSSLWQYVESIAKKTAHDFGFQEVRTPIFEQTEVFIRSVGETSDIVSKEMYTFQDKGNRSITLRPEGTAAIMRAFVENNLAQAQNFHKFFYIAPMFRYDRPQAGRYRQHHQFGVEYIGATDPWQDAETIDLLWSFYKKLGLTQLHLYINSVGDAETRNNFKTAFTKFLLPLQDRLSNDSKARLEKNPLRILDSKDTQDKEILQNAPSILEYLSLESQKHFSDLKTALEKIGIPFTVNDKLVRGLDYYSNTVFEVTAGKLGAQNSLGGGGRYDHLLSSFGGPDLPGIGFGIGLERVIQTLLEQNIPYPKASSPLIYLIPLGEKAKEFCFPLLSQLRHKQIFCEMEWRANKIQKALQNANKLACSYCLIIGEEEIVQQKATLKNMLEKTEETIPFANLLETIQKLK